MFDDWEALGAAAQRYADAFGETPPLVLMPDDPAEQLALILAAVESGEPYRPDVPEDADI